MSLAGIVNSIKTFGTVFGIITGTVAVGGGTIVAADALLDTNGQTILGDVTKKLGYPLVRTGQELEKQGIVSSIGNWLEDFGQLLQRWGFSGFGNVLEDWGRAALEKDPLNKSNTNIVTANAGNTVLAGTAENNILVASKADLAAQEGGLFQNSFVHGVSYGIQGFGLGLAGLTEKGLDWLDIGNNKVDTVAGWRDWAERNVVSAPDLSDNYSWASIGTYMGHGLGGVATAGIMGPFGIVASASTLATGGFVSSFAAATNNVVNNQLAASKTYPLALNLT